MLSLNRRMECDCELIKWNLVNEWTISKCWWKETVYRDWSVDDVMSKNVIIAWISISDWKRMKWWIWWWWENKENILMTAKKDPFLFCASGVVGCLTASSLVCSSVDGDYRVYLWYKCNLFPVIMILWKKTQMSERKWKLSKTT